MRTHKRADMDTIIWTITAGPFPMNGSTVCTFRKIWEQMTTAYESGVRELWIVNVGDIATQEFPPSYFLDMAYDFGRWKWCRQSDRRVYQTVDEAAVWKLYGGKYRNRLRTFCRIYQIDKKEKT